MESLWLGKLALAALLALCAMALVRSRAAALAVPLSLVAALTLLGMLLPRLSGLRGELSALLGSAGLTGELFSPLLRVLAAGEITRFTAELCRDSGEKALAVSVELCGAAGQLTPAQPTFSAPYAEVSR